MGVNNSTNDIFHLLAQFKQQRGSDYYLKSLGVFGSVARGEADAESDVDVVFETDRPNLFRTSSLRQELQGLLNRPVDVVRLRTRMNPNLRASIEREARYV
jgi:predicted nucleotidyltransferase